jgi:hypothetical protein
VLFKIVHPEKWPYNRLPLANYQNANWDRCNRENAARHPRKVTAPQGDLGSDQQTHDETRKRHKEEHS